MYYMVECEFRLGPGSVSASVGVRDTAGVPSYLEVDRTLVVHQQGKSYLPIGVVYRDREKGVALIEFPEEANTGHRLWVPLGSLHEDNGAKA